MKTAALLLSIYIILLFSTSNLHAALWIKFGGGYDVSKNYRSGQTDYESNSTGTSFEISAAYFVTHFNKLIVGFGPYYYSGSQETKSMVEGDGSVTKFSISHKRALGGVFYLKLLDVYLYGGYANYKSELTFDKYINEKSTLSSTGYHGGIGFIAYRFGLAGIYLEGTGRWVKYETESSTTLNSSSIPYDHNHNQVMYTFGTGIIIPISFNFLDYVAEEITPPGVEDDGDEIYEEIEMERERN